MTEARPPEAQHPETAGAVAGGAVVQASAAGQINGLDTVDGRTAGADRLRAPIVTNNICSS